MTIFDAETGPLPDAELETVKPVFKAPANYKDPAKIAAALVEAEVAWKADAALDAKTAQVLCIGLLDDDATRFLTGPEGAILEAFWEVWDAGERMVGFNCKDFDMRMLWQRSIVAGVKVPMDLMEGRYWSRRIVDLQEIWLCFGRDTKGQSLDAVCRALKIGRKSGDGADFAKLFATDRDSALAYVGMDLELTAKLATRLGIQ